MALTTVRVAIETKNREGTQESVSDTKTLDTPAGEGKNKLYGLCVGNNSYGGVRGKLAFVDQAPIPGP